MRQGLRPRLISTNNQTEIASPMDVGAAARRLEGDAVLQVMAASSKEIFFVLRQFDGSFFVNWILGVRALL